MICDIIILNYTHYSTLKGLIILNRKLVIIFISIILISGGVYLKMKHDEKEKFYNEQKERITLYLKYNIKTSKVLNLQVLKVIQWVVMQ